MSTRRAAADCQSLASKVFAGRFLADLRRTARSPGFPLLATALLLTTTVLLAAHRFQHRIARIDPTPASEMRWFNLSVEGGLGERFEFCLLLACGVAAADIAWRMRSPIFAVIAFIFLLTLADGSLGLHERFGFAVGPVLGIHSDTGQLLWFFALGAALLPAILIAYRRSSPDERIASLLVLAMILVLGGFAVVVDAFQAIFDIANLIEDGGELVTIAALCFLMLAIRMTLLRRPE